MTANSFTSLSRDPARVLWSLSRKSANFQAYCAAKRFAINVLSLEQQALCMRFAGRCEGDRFEGVELEPGLLDLPLLKSALAHFECSKWAQYDVGDHVALVGRIERFVTAPGDPLIFAAGQFCAGMPLPKAPA